MPGGSGRREGGARSLAQSAGTTQVAGDNRDQTLKRESATIIGQKAGGACRVPKYVLYDTPRCPGTPVPRYPGTFLAWHGLHWLWPAALRLWDFLGSVAAKWCSGDRQGSPHFASPQPKEFPSQTTPRTPQGCMSELHKLFMNRTRAAGMNLSLHCTVPQR